MRKLGSNKVIVGVLAAAMVFGSAMPALAAQGWKQTKTGWWYENADGGYTTSSWQMINDTWYYFDANGYMSTGWIMDSGRWYFADATGAMQTGWVQVGGEYYYLNPISNGTKGAMQTGEVTVGGNVFHFNESGACTDTVMLSQTIPQYYANGEVYKTSDHPSGGSGGGRSGGSGGSSSSSVTKTAQETNKKVVEKVNEAKKAAEEAGIVGKDAPIEDITISTATNTSEKTVSVKLNEEQKAETTVADVSEAFMASAEAVIEDENVDKIVYGDMTFDKKNVAKEYLAAAAESQKTLDELKSSYSFDVTLKTGEVIKYTISLK